MKGFIASLAVLIGLSSITMSTVTKAQDKNKTKPTAVRKVAVKPLNKTAPPRQMGGTIMAEADKKNSFQSGGTAVWGVGPDSPFGRVYLWTGADWKEPNPRASLKQISARTQDGGAWGIGADQRIFTTTDGLSWAEPNPAAKLNQISGDLYKAWGIGDSNRVFLSVDEGKSWFEPTPQTKLKQIAAGDSDNVWGLTPDGHVLKYYSGPYYRWLEPNPAARLNQISAMAGEGAWGIGAENRIFVTLDGLSWTEPNPSAKLFQISAQDDSNAWGIGAGNRIFRTQNRGASWSEPNPQARLKQVSAQCF
jgi:hypothetical protein